MLDPDASVSLRSSLARGNASCGTKRRVGGTDIVFGGMAGSGVSLGLGFSLGEADVVRGAIVGPTATAAVAVDGEDGTNAVHQRRWVTAVAHQRPQRWQACSHHGHAWLDTGPDQDIGDGGCRAANGQD